MGNFFWSHGFFRAIVLNAKLIHAGWSHSLSVDKNNRLWSWGSDGHAELGITNTGQVCIPNSVYGVKKTFCAINGYYTSSMALDKNGQVWGWGYNNKGQIGDNSVTHRNTPVSIQGSKKTFCKIGAGYNHSLAIDKTGQLWGWGYNAWNQLGLNGANTNRCTPMSVLGAKKTFCQIAGGDFYTIGLDKNGQIWSWGASSYGQLGNYSIINATTPVSIQGAKKTFCKIAQNFYLHAAGIDKNGQIWSWGYNAQGELGDNSTESRCTPVSIQGAKKTFCQITSGLAIDMYGQVWGWGSNPGGKIGDNTNFNYSTPVSIQGVKKTFCYISSNYRHTLGIDSHGDVWGWGYDSSGQLGDGYSVSRMTPVRVCNFVIESPYSVEIAAVGNYFSIVIDKTDGSIWSWGFNTQGQLGDNSVLCKSVPASIQGSKKTFCKIGVGGGNDFLLAIDNTGQVWAWGNNNNGQLGDNSVISRRTPVSIQGSKKTFSSITIGAKHTIAIDNNYVLWGWGYNFYGQLGVNSTVSRRTPVSIQGAKKTFCQIKSGNNHTVGIDKNGQIWGWGYNFYGQLGVNSTASDRCTPVSIQGAKKTFCQITAGRNHTIGIDKNGQVWGWGRNGYGQLGDNSITSRLTPISLLGAKKTFCKINSGADQTIGIDKNGQVWSWGINLLGALGDNSVVSRRTPVSILGAKKTFCSILPGNYHAIVVDNYGQVWGWGYNLYGQVGDGTVISRLTPVRIKSFLHPI